MMLQGWLALGLIGVVMPAFSQGPGANPSLAASYNEFGFKLLTQVRQDAPGKNVFLSPLGLSLALSMAADGAGGETLREMQSVLQLRPGLRASELNRANQALTAGLAKLDGKIQLKIANSIWTAEDLGIKNEYVSALQSFYQAEAASVNFKDPATANRINGWVSDHTAGKITRMVDPPLDQNRVILLDAIYFKGDWASPFDKSLTRDAPFTLGNGRSVTHPRMTRSGEMSYCENDAFQAVCLRYTGNAVSFYLFLPKGGLDGFLPQLTMRNWRRWQMDFGSRKGTLEMPRFKLENEYNLKPPLQALGMVRPFDRLRAEFGGISDERLFIDWIKQKTYVDVNEQGTEAAAVTGMGFRALVIRREEPPFRMVVDRPFFLAIQDAQSGTFLFLGAILDPR